MPRTKVPAPAGYRWATGGGSPIGECNGLHLARVNADGSSWPGTLCGRYGPATTIAFPGSRLCGNCARIAKLPRVVGNA